MTVSMVPVVFFAFALAAHSAYSGVCPFAPEDMFKVKSCKPAIRPVVLHAYQGQGTELEVEFNCSNGVQRCSRAVLDMYSDYFSEQMNGREQFENTIRFNYDEKEAKFTKECIRHFLDALHAIEISFSSLAELLMLIKFIQYEGKSSSTFEKSLTRMLREQLKKATLSIDTKLLLCVVADTFDDFKGRLEQNLFGANVKYTLIEMQNGAFNLNLETDQNKKLIELIDGDKDDVNKYVTSEVFLLAKQLNVKFNTNAAQTISPETQKQDETKTEEKEDEKAKKTVNNKTKGQGGQPNKRQPKNRNRSKKPGKQPSSAPQKPSLGQPTPITPEYGSPPPYGYYASGYDLQSGQHYALPYQGPYRPGGYPQRGQYKSNSNLHQK